MASSTASSSSVGVFRGEGDRYVDLLITSCSQAKRNSLEAPFDASLIGRPLQPFDFGTDELPNTASAGKQHSGSKRKGSPPKASSSSGSGSSSPSRESPSHNAKASLRNSSGNNSAFLNNKLAAAQPIMISPGTGKAKSAKLGANPTPLSTSPASSSGFACPGMFSSPKPEMLPMPSPAALMRAANAMPAVGSPQPLLVAV